MSNAERIAALRAEADRLEEFGNEPFAYGQEIWIVDMNGQVQESIWDGESAEVEWFSQGRVKTTEREAVLFSKWEKAVNTVNRAILAGERGDSSPYFNRYRSEWMLSGGADAAFATGSRKNIQSVIKSHPAEFAAIREYQRVVLERGE